MSHVEERRMDVAERLDGRPDMCWPRLYAWAVDREPLRDCRINHFCRDDAARNGHCFCGKIGGPS